MKQGISFFVPFGSFAVAVDRLLLLGKGNEEGVENQSSQYWQWPLPTIFSHFSPTTTTGITINISTTTNTECSASHRHHPSLQNTFPHGCSYRIMTKRVLYVVVLIHQLGKSSGKSDPFQSDVYFGLGFIVINLPHRDLPPPTQAIRVCVLFFWMLERKRLALEKAALCPSRFLLRKWK